MKQKNIQDFERESGRSSLIIGLVCIGFGIVLGAVVAKDTSVVSGVIIFIIMLAAGLFAMNFKKLERASRAKRADPTSSAYQKKQQRLEKVGQALREKSRHHKTLHDETNLRYMTIAGVILGIMVLINAVSFFVFYSYSVIMIVFALCALAFFIYTLTGKEYKSALAAFANYGCDEKQAEEIFSNMYLYRDAGSNTVALGERFLILKSMNNLVPTERLVWVFPRLQWVYNYTNGIYTGRSDKYSLNFCMKNGDYYNVEVDQAAIPCIMEDIQALRPGVVCGYSEEISDLYARDPAGFEEAEKTVPADPCAMLAPSEDEQPPKRK